MFKVYGEDKEVTAIEPYLIITHSCDNGIINPVSFQSFLFFKFNQKNFL